MDYSTYLNDEISVLKLATYVAQYHEDLHLS